MLLVGLAGGIVLIGRWQQTKAMNGLCGKWQSSSSGVRLEIDRKDNHYRIWIIEPASVVCYRLRRGFYPYWKENGMRVEIISVPSRPDWLLLSSGSLYKRQE